MKFLIINGPNLNFLGVREPEIYGRATYGDLLEFIENEADVLGVEAEVQFSNHEGGLVDIIQSAYGKADGIVINPAAYTHTSIAILDALTAVGLPAVEVHITNPSERDYFRQTSYVREACIATIAGLGFEGYAEAMRILKEYCERKK